MKNLTEKEIFEAMGETQDGGELVLRQPKDDDLISQVINDAVTSFDNDDIGEISNRLSYAIDQLERAKKQIDDKFNSSQEIER